MSRLMNERITDSDIKAVCDRMAGTTASLTYDAKADLIAHALERTKPAFYDGFQLITRDMTYDIVEACGKWELRRAQELSLAGFERNVLRNCTSDGHYHIAHEWASYVQFNRAAEAFRIQLDATHAQQIVDRERIADEQAKEREKQNRIEAEHRASIDALAQAATWKKTDITLRGEGWSESVSAKVSGLVAVHKHLGQWKVTHVPSGFMMTSFDTQHEAKIAAVRLAEFDLTRSVAELVKDPALRDLARAMRRTSDVYAIV